MEGGLGVRCCEVLASDDDDPPQKVVFRGTVDGTEADVAVKVYASDDEVLDERLGDLSISETCVRVYELSVVGSARWVVMACCDCSVGDCVALLRSPLTEDEVKAAAHGALHALAPCHAVDLGHGNVKPNNLLLSHGELFLSDAGMAPFSTDPHPAQVCPEGPEPAESPAADIWALGVTLLELVDRTPPFYQLSAPEIQASLEASVPEPLSKRFDGAAEMTDFVKLCLERDPVRRCTVDELLQHAWFAGYTAVERDHTLQAMSDKLQAVLEEWTAVNGEAVPRVRLVKLFKEQVAASLQSFASSGGGGA
eukprot:gene15893-24294_t